MNWLDIVFELEEDEMIQSCGCDGLLDAFYSLKGLYHMSELQVNLTNEFILDVINHAIDGRNRYCGLVKMEKLPHVKIKNGEFEWKDWFEDLED